MMSARMVRRGEPRLLRGLAVLIGLAAVLGVQIGAVGAQEVVRVVSWGGASQENMRETWFDPYTELTGVEIIEDTWNGELGKVRSMVDAGQPTWDVVNGDYAHAVAGCDEDVVERIDVERLGGADAYLEGTVHECGVPTHIFSVIFGYDADNIPAAWGDARPSTVDDAFDLERFPGKRTIRKDPKWVLEPALVADGVPPDQIYQVLSTPEGVKRALAKLDTIRDQVIWWTAGATPPQLLADGEVAIAQMYSTRLHLARVNENKNFVPIWDGQTFAANSWIIPRGANKEAAMQFLEYITQPKIVAKITNKSNHGMPILAAQEFVPAEVQDWLPTAPANLDRAVASGESWWADHYEEVNERFQRWLAQ